MVTHRSSLNTQEDARQLRRLGGRLCLDFVNTVDLLRGQPLEHLRSYADLLTWSAQAGTLDARSRQARQLRAAAQARPAEAAVALADALALRDALQRAFTAIARGASSPAVDLDELKHAWLAALRRARLTPEPLDHRYDWTWEADDLALERPLWPVLADAIALLGAPELARVKQCGEGDPEGCHWLFVDASKNGSRHWCSMEGCGSQAKMRRQYAKRKAARASGASPA